jgi:DNA-binding transcriptional LysR family regulator
MLNETPLSRIDLNLLVLFEVVLAEGHVGRAAKRLSLSPSAVSHGLRRLRELLNDPLFLKHPKGIVPTERATALAAPIAAILAQVRNVVATADPFDPKTSTRRFRVGAPDAALAVILPPLLARIRASAPNVDVAVQHLQVAPWSEAFDVLDARGVDVAIIPLADVPARFVTRALYGEDFVVAMRADHPLRTGLTLKRYCEALHVLVSPIGDARGHVDRALAERGMARRVMLTVPNFMLALTAIADTDLLCAVPRNFLAAQAQRFRLVSAELPLNLGDDPLRAVAPKVALADGGVAWFVDALVASTASGRSARNEGRRQR